MKGMQCLLAMFVGGLIGLQPVQAQPAKGPSRPSVSSRNAAFRFVPRHERIAQQRAIPEAVGRERIEPDNANTAAESVRTASASAVQPASHWYEPPTTLDANYVDPACRCVESCVDPCENSACFPMIWGRAEYLHWWTNGVTTPSLVTTSPTGTDQEDAGVLGRLGTSTLFGGNEFHDSGRSGGRYALGMWLNPMRTTALEVTYLSLEDDTESFSGSGNDFSILARPFFNIDLNEEDSRLIALDGLVEGSMSVETSSEFESFELLLRRPARQSYNGRMDLLFGYRTARLDERIRFDESTTSLSGPTLNSEFELFDEFSAENEFQGGQLGFQFIGNSGPCWSLGLTAKVALGNTDSRVSVLGQTDTTTAIGDSSSVPGGLLTQTSNVGSFDDDKFSTISELGVSLRRDCACGLTATFGYTFLVWTDVARAIEQIDSSVNPTQIPPGTLVGETRPRFAFERSDFWAQGLNLGLEYHF